MNYLRTYNIFEKSLSDAKKELKQFQEELDIDTNIKEILDSIDALKVDVSTNPIFNELDNNDNIDDLIQDSDFSSDMKDVMMKPSEIISTNNLSTFSRIPMRFFWIYAEDSIEIENEPVYIVLQYEIKTEDGLGWSKPSAYYVNKNIDGFYNILSKVVLDINQTNGNRKWTYVTSNSGEDWQLINKDDVTNTFRYELDWDRIIFLSKHKDVDLVFR